MEIRFELSCRVFGLPAGTGGRKSCAHGQPDWMVGCYGVPGGYYPLSYRATRYDCVSASRGSTDREVLRSANQNNSRAHRRGIFLPIQPCTNVRDFLYVCVCEASFCSLSLPGAPIRSTYLLGSMKEKEIERERVR